MLTIQKTLKSHPHQHLFDHVDGVKQLVEKFSNNAMVTFDNDKKKLYKNLAIIIACFHDLAKSTSYFQNYIVANKERQIELKGKPHYRHSLFSAIAGSYFAYEYLKKTKMIEKECRFYSTLVYVVIRRHHSNLTDWQQEYITEEDVLIDQAKSIDWQEVITYMDFWLKNIDSTFDFNSLSASWFENALKVVKKNMRLDVVLKDKKSLEDGAYIYLKLLFSILIDADKSQVGIRQDVEFYDRNLLMGLIKKELVDNYKSSFSTQSKLDNLREQAYQESNSFEIKPSHNILRLNLPTGLGKTLTSYSLAMRWKSEIEKWSGGEVQPRIIYSLPFTSVIDQNEMVLRDIFEYNNKQCDESILLKHHHLTDIKYEKSLEETNYEISNDSAKLLVESWNSEIIVTTFVQLFETMITNKNVLSKKFHRFANSIFIIDEYQAIPFRFNKALSFMIKQLAELLNCKFILMTATDPKWFTESEAPFVCNPANYFSELNRVTLSVDVKDGKMNERTVNEYSKDIAQEMLSNKNKSYLIVLNTINCAKEMYDNIKEIIVDEEIGYLSTYITPHDRKIRIEKMKEKKYRIAITTQIVEAGVDIDFDVVIRDIAPLDSINQAAGRCNRHGNNGKGEVRVIKLVKIHDKGEIMPFSKFVYGSINVKSQNIYDLRLSVTEKIITQKQQWSESEFLKNVETYFNELDKVSNQLVSNSLVDSIKQLVYNTEDKNKIAINDFRLIDVHETNSLFIEVNKEASELWKQFVSIFSDQTKGLFEKKKEWEKMKSKFQNYVINVDVGQEHLPNKDTHYHYGFYYVESSMVDQFYDVGGYGYKKLSDIVLSI